MAVIVFWSQGLGVVIGFDFRGFPCRIFAFVSLGIGADWLDGSSRLGIVNATLEADAGGASAAGLC